MYFSPHVSHLSDIAQRWYLFSLNFCNFLYFCYNCRISDIRYVLPSQLCHTYHIWSNCQTCWFAIIALMISFRKQISEILPTLNAFEVWLVLCEKGKSFIPVCINMNLCKQFNNSEKPFHKKRTSTFAFEKWKFFHLRDFRDKMTRIWW